MASGTVGLMRTFWWTANQLRQMWLLIQRPISAIVAMRQGRGRHGVESAGFLGNLARQLREELISRPDSEGTSGRDRTPRPDDRAANHRGQPGRRRATTHVH